MKWRLIAKGVGLTALMMTAALALLTAADSALRRG